MDKDTILTNISKSVKHLNIEVKIKELTYDIYDFVSQIIEEYQLSLYNNTIVNKIINGVEYSHGSVDINYKYYIKYFIYYRDLDNIYLKLYKNDYPYNSTKFFFEPSYDGVDSNRKMCLNFNKIEFCDYLIFLDRTINEGKKKEIIKQSNRTVKEAYMFLETISRDKGLDVYYDNCIKLPIGTKGDIKEGHINFGKLVLVYSSYPAKPELMLVKLYNKDGDEYFDDEYGFIRRRKKLMNYIELSRLVIILDEDILIKKRKNRKVITLPIKKRQIKNRSDDKNEVRSVHSNFNISRFYRNRIFGIPEIA